MDLSNVSLKQLKAELARRKQPAPKVIIIQEVQPKPKPKRYKAGENLKSGVLCVVDERTGECFEHPRTPIIDGVRRIHGYTVAKSKKGERIKLRHWCFADVIMGQ
jgi:hypothetical protein